MERVLGTPKGGRAVYRMGRSGIIPHVMSRNIYHAAMKVNARLTVPDNEHIAGRLWYRPYGLISEGGGYEKGIRRKTQRIARGPPKGLPVNAAADGQLYATGQKPGEAIVDHGIQSESQKMRYLPSRSGSRVILMLAGCGEIPASICFIVNENEGSTEDVSAGCRFNVCIATAMHVVDSARSFVAHSRVVAGYRF